MKHALKKYEIKRKLKRNSCETFRGRKEKQRERKKYVYLCACMWD